jgi:hypothetical protein
MISNIRCTTKVAVNALLSDNAVLQERGSAIIHNLACKEVKTVVCIPHTQKHICACPLLLTFLTTMATMSH